MNWHNKIFCFSILLTFCFTNCSEKNVKKVNPNGKCFFIETINFSNDLKMCFGNSIYGKWANKQFHLQDSLTLFAVRDTSPKHTFKDIQDFKPLTDSTNIEKLSISLKGNLSTGETSFSILHFKLNQNKDWQQTTTFIDLPLKDRDNDFISPNQLDVDELCEQIIKATIKSSY